MLKSLTRRAGFALLLACTLGAQAQTAWPSRPVRMLVPAPAGTGPDVMCRQVSQRLGERLGQPLPVENRPGASGHVAAEVVAKSAPDGYTILCGVNSTFVTTPHLMPKLTYDPLKDLQPVVMLGRANLLLVANPGVPADDLPSLITWIKANPGTVSYATFGVGSNTHLAMEVFKARTGVSMVHIPYNTPVALTDLASGRVQLMVDSAAAAGPFLRDGRIKLIAIASASPMPEYPKAQVAGKTVPGFEATGWAGLFVPAAVPSTIVARLAAEVPKVLELKEVRDAFATMGFVPEGMGADETRRYMRAEYDHWGQVIRAANIRLE